MNKVITSGVFVRNPEVKYTTGENASAIARFTIASSRKFKNAEGKYDADFINCVAFGKTAEFVEKYFTKGSRTILDGRIQTGSYTNKDGQKVYTTDVVVENIEFGSSKGDGDQNNGKTASEDTSFLSVPDDVDDDIMPF